MTYSNSSDGIHATFTSASGMEHTHITPRPSAENLYATNSHSHTNFNSHINANANANGNANNSVPTTPPPRRRSNSNGNSNSNSGNGSGSLLTALGGSSTSVGINLVAQNGRVQEAFAAAKKAAMQGKSADQFVAEFAATNSGMGG
jgi:hypothetical protein